MIRAPRAVARALRHASTQATAVSSVKFNPVKFQKEDVEKVMAELPEFNFYEIKEGSPNPYKEVTLDRSILLETPKPVLSAPKAEFSQLENGLKIVSIDKQGLTARLGLFVNAGSRFENSSNFGVSDMVSMMGYHSTAHLSHLRTVKTLEQLGSNASSSCKAGREEIAYNVDVLREYVPLVIPLMVGNVLFPRLLPWEVKSAQKKVKEGKEALLKDPAAMVSDLLHKAAFCNNTLGFSTTASERSISYFTPETVRSYMLDHFAPERMVMVGVNVSHEELTKWVSRSFADYNAIPLKKREEPKAVYTGGDMRAEGNTDLCHVAIGFESVPLGQKEMAPIAVLQAILGGGEAGSKVGAGVTSRLSTQVVKQNPYVESCSAFNTSYSDSGVFGVYGVAQADKAGEMVHSMAKTLKGLSSVGKDELTKAKAMLKGQLYRQLDDDSTLVQDMGTQVMLTGGYGSASDYAKIIDGVTEADVTAAAKKLLSSRPSIAAFGDTHTVPHYAAVEAAFKA
eukprot:CAMPEP_0206440330 /NCGR_PEP_ID=MMETSP0324_2-20121206/12700_1 /ASSEMBLY_ACC=CAM_ASM_000836 /TAXON_ID=2866 /ORGANISM="Crypthecodinium cohnii, Strain Seligo" /LENGTH=509 /DNA_ID=CAMNT_0053908037 /DNA_START=84 /DNA_END=1613 /DNA_ORIENTATION=-